GFSYDDTATATSSSPSVTASSKREPACRPRRNGSGRNSPPTRQPSRDCHYGWVFADGTGSRAASCAVRGGRSSVRARALSGRSPTPLPFGWLYHPGQWREGQVPWRSTAWSTFVTLVGSDESMGR